jgi:hypothetical protein
VVVDGAISVDGRGFPATDGACERYRIGLRAMNLAPPEGQVRGRSAVTLPPRSWWLGNVANGGGCCKRTGGGGGNAGRGGMGGTGRAIRSPTINGEGQALTHASSRLIWAGRWIRNQTVSLATGGRAEEASCRPRRELGTGAITANGAGTPVIGR